MWGHVTSDLWWGCQLVVDVATSGRAAALYVLAWLKHNHTLLTRSQPVWWREGRAQGGCRRPESRVEAQETDIMTDGHITCTQAGKHRGTHTHMDISTNIYNHASEHPHTHTNQITVEVDRRRKTSSWIQLLLIFNLTMTSVMCFNCLNHFNDIVVAMDRYRIHD